MLSGPSKERTTTGSLLNPDGLSVLSFVDPVRKPFWDFVNLSNTGLQNLEGSVRLSPSLVRVVQPLVVPPLGLVAEPEILRGLFLSPIVVLCWHLRHAKHTFFFLHVLETLNARTFDAVSMSVPVCTRILRLTLWS